MPKIPNEIIYNQEDDSMTIRVTRRDGSKHDVIVDKGLYAILLSLKLHIYVAPVTHNRKEFYARTYIQGKQYLLHRLILDGFLTDSKSEVDHINPYNTLDNRWCNLRPADRKMNMNNLKKHHHVPYSPPEMN